MKETDLELKAKIKKLDMAILLLGTVFMLLSITQYSYVKQQENQMRVRFERPAMNAEQLDGYYRQQKESQPDSIRNSAKNPAKTAGIPDVTLWNLLPGTASVRSEEGFQSNGFTMIEGYGNLERIMPGLLAEGVYPPKGDTDGCAMSEAGAQALFGSSNVIGMLVTAGGKEYRIRGIVECNDNVLWIQNPDADGFSNLEMYYSSKMPVSSAKEWLNQIGLGSPAAILPGCDYVSFNQFFMTLPLWVMFLYLFWGIRQQVRLASSKYRRILLTVLWCAALGGFVILGVQYSFRFSLDYIPKQWSDLSFYGNRAAALKKAAQNIAELKSFEGDTMLLESSRRCAYFAWAALAAAVLFCVRHRRFCKVSYCSDRAVHPAARHRSQ